MIRREIIPPEAGTLEGDVIIRKGQRIRGKSIHDLAAELNNGDIISKGANAVSLATGESAVLIGNPTAGTMSPIYQAAIGRRVRVIVPAGVEKRVDQPIYQLCQIVNNCETKGLRSCTIHWTSLYGIGCHSRFNGYASLFDRSGGWM